MTITMPGGHTQQIGPAHDLLEYFSDLVAFPAARLSFMRSGKEI
jgi:hypothetical protein